MARYLREGTTSALSIYDVGGRLVMSGPRYALSAELVRRYWRGEAAPASQHRISGMIEYKLREEVWLFGALGKDYEEAAKDSFLTRLGMSFSLKKERYKSTQ